MFDPSVWEIEFADRFARHSDELKWLYYELYHSDEQAYQYFVGMIYRAYQSRSEALKALDRQREAFPAWYKGRNMNGMLMYASRFAGTLRGVRDRLDYIEDCGVNYLHLMPLLESPKGRSDGGYAVSDFRTVQKELGTMEDLADLTSACHARGIAVCLDFVMNHTSEDQAKRNTRIGISSMTAGRSRTNSKKPSRRFSPPPRPAIFPGARRQRRSL